MGTTSTTTTTTTTTVAPRTPGKLFTCGSYSGWSSSAVFLKAKSALDCSDISAKLGHGTTCQSDKNDDKPGTFLKIPSGQCATVIAGGAFAGLGAQCDGWGNWTPKFSSETACATAVDKLNTHFATPLPLDCVTVPSGYSFKAVSLGGKRLCCPMGWNKYGDGSGCTDGKDYCYTYGNDLGSSTPHPCPSVSALL